mgnify:CR=1 FL=1
MAMMEKDWKLGKKWKGQTFQVHKTRKLFFFFHRFRICNKRIDIWKFLEKKFRLLSHSQDANFSLKLGLFEAENTRLFEERKYFLRFPTIFHLLHTYVTNKKRNKFSCPIHFKWLLMPLSEKVVVIMIGIVRVILILSLICNWQDCIFAA